MQDLPPQAVLDLPGEIGVGPTTHGAVAANVAWAASVSLG